MLPWNKTETADIIYDDTMGEFTRILIDRGYLGADEWRDARPRYYLEVKSTAGPCGTPFYMSRSQYQLVSSRLFALLSQSGFINNYGLTLDAQSTWERTLGGVHRYARF